MGSTDIPPVVDQNQKTEVSSEWVFESHCVSHCTYCPPPGLSEKIQSVFPGSAESAVREYVSLVESCEDVAASECVHLKKYYSDMKLHWYDCIKDHLVRFVCCVLRSVVAFRLTTNGCVFVCYFNSSQFSQSFPMATQSCHHVVLC